VLPKQKLLASTLEIEAMPPPYVLA
jgi:hypothetical protein